jgi:hypothetical protein
MPRNPPSEAATRGIHLSCLSIIEVVRLLLDEGAEIEYRCQDEWTAVNVASYRGFLECEAMFIGAHLNVLLRLMSAPLSSNWRTTSI